MIKRRECRKHKWEASRDSIFGLNHVHAILECRDCENYPKHPPKVYEVKEFEIIEKRGKYRYFLKGEPRS